MMMLSSTAIFVHCLLLGMTLLRLVLYCFPLPPPMAITSNDAARLLRWPRESVMPAPDTAMQSSPGEAVRDAAIQPRLVLVFFASFLFTDAMRVSFTAAVYVISLGVLYTRCYLSSSTGAGLLAAVVISFFFAH